MQLEAGVVFGGYRPRGRLSAAVELIWTVDGVADVSGERVLPNGVVEVIINLADPHREVRGPGRFTRYRRAWIAGLQRGPLDIASEKTSRLVGVRFRPGGAAPVLGLPLRALTDEVVEVEGALAPAFLRLRERLFEARSEGERVSLVELCLDRMLGDRAVDPRIARAVARWLGRTTPRRCAPSPARSASRTSTSSTSFTARSGWRPGRSRASCASTG